MSKNDDIQFTLFFYGVKEKMEKPSYYSILPAKVRYDRDLSFFEKILYSEISALTNVDGYCTASNNYFSNLYDKSFETISRAISKLEKKQVIKIEVEKKGCVISDRKIYLFDCSTIDENINRTIDKNVNRTIDENVKENNTSILIIQDIKESKKEKQLAEAIAILNYFNEYCQTSFKNISINISPILRRLGEGYTFNDFKTVIEKKYKSWNNTEFVKFLRPETIFGKRFESYLNEKDFKKETKSKSNMAIYNYSDEELTKQFNNLDDIEI